MKPYYEDNAVKIYHGDCVEIMTGLEPVDHVITDPPYSEYVNSVSGGQPEDGRYCSISDLGFDSLAPSLRTACAKAFADAARRWCLVFSDVESCHLWRDDLVGSGLEYIRTCAWHKIGATPQFTGDRPAAGFEAITVAHPAGAKRWHGGGELGVYSFPVVRGKENRHHPTEKPLPLMSKLVSLFTDPGETIIDPFMGSGTTLRAAKDLKRKAIGIERQEKFCEIAAKRLSQEVLF